MPIEGAACAWQVAPPPSRVCPSQLVRSPAWYAAIHLARRSVPFHWCICWEEVRVLRGSSRVPLPDGNICGVLPERWSYRRLFWEELRKRVFQAFESGKKTAKGSSYFPKTGKRRGNLSFWTYRIARMGESWRKCRLRGGSEVRCGWRRCICGVWRNRPTWSGASRRRAICA